MPERLEGRPPSKPQETAQVAADGPPRSSVTASAPATTPIRVGEGRKADRSGSGGANRVGLRQWPRQQRGGRWSRETLCRLSEDF